MLRLSKNDGDKISHYRFDDEDSLKDNNWSGCGYTYIRDINFDKHYINERYCRVICGNCYNFGCDWDIRCNKNNKPIQQVVNDCDRFKNGERLYNEMIKKIESDKDFYNFCKIVNSIMNKGRESKLEIFLGVFNRRF